MMPRFYISAYTAEGAPILGNLDGQAAITAQQPTRCALWKKLFSTDTRLKWPRVAYWQLETASGQILATRHNPYHKAQ